MIEISNFFIETWQGFRALSGLAQVALVVGMVAGSVAGRLLYERYLAQYVRRG